MKKLQIDIVSDVMCPWCIVGYKGLEMALDQLSSEVEADINWLPFELNPQMPVEGQDLREHLMEKYGITEQQSDQNRDMIAQRGQDVGFTFNYTDRLRMINSFDCHRLLTWAKDQGKQHQLQMALFTAHFDHNRPLNEKDELLAVVTACELDVQQAKDILNSDAYADQVRAGQNQSMQMGIQSVPTFIINRKYALSGGQPVAAFRQALTQILEAQNDVV